MASPFVPVDLDKLLDEFEENEEGGCLVIQENNVVQNKNQHQQLLNNSPFIFN